MKNQIEAKITEKLKNHNTKKKCYFYYYSLTTTKGLIDGVRQLLTNYQIILGRRTKTYKLKQINTGTHLLIHSTNIWVGTTTEEMTITKLMEIASLPTSPLILKTICLNDRILYVKYGDDSLTIDPNISDDDFFDLFEVPGAEILSFNKSPLLIIYAENVNTRNE